MTTTTPHLRDGQSAGIRPVRRALLSVYDKQGVVELGKSLHSAGAELISTGQTAAVLREAGLPVTAVEELTGFGEALGGRVKTLHPAVHAGLLADTANPDHVQQLVDLGFETIDLLVSNLYPFTQTVASGASPEECVEQIDIGGPAMLRAAAKNHRTVAVVTSPADYEAAAQAVAGGGFTLAQRQEFAARAFAHTASYDAAVATWMAERITPEGDAPAWLGVTGTLQQSLRYGENPHQKAALYATGEGGVAWATQLHGKAMSYNNYVDADAAMQAAYGQGDQPTCAIIKHANPCGIAVAETIAQAHELANACDPVSAFGGIIAVNVEVDEAMARQVAQVFTEVVVAPSFSDAAMQILSAKKNVRLLVAEQGTSKQTVRQIAGGLLVQDLDVGNAVLDGGTGGDDPSLWRLVSGDLACEETLADLRFAWQAIRAVRSNAILLARGGASVGVGMGQVNRVDSARLAVDRAGAERAAGAVAASDAFFPFADGLQILLDAGVKAVVAPGGSVRDEEVIAAAKKAGVTMYFTGTRHFTH